MELLSLIDTLTEKIESASSIPLSGKSLIDKEDILELIQEIKLKMPDDLKKAKWITDSREEILENAKKDAAARIEKAKSEIITMMSETEIARQARELATDIENKANANAAEIKMGVMRYSDQILNGIGGTVHDAKNVLEKAMSDINNSVDLINKTLAVIEENRKELRN